jgi:hypothetical protein
VVDPLDQYLRQADPALQAATSGAKPSAPESLYGAAMGGYAAAQPARPGSPASSYAGSMHSMATSVATGARPASPRQRKAAAGAESEGGFEVSEDEQKLLAAIQVLEAAMQAVDRTTPEGRSESARLQSPSPLPGGGAARKGRTSRDGWAGSLVSASHRARGEPCACARPC